MEEDKGLIKILKWVGILALIAVPILVLFKKDKSRSSSGDWDESDIYSSEIEE